MPTPRWRLVLLCGFLLVAEGAFAAAPRVLEHVVVYEDPLFYVAFPSVVRRPDGELLLAFRRAPERRKFGDGGVSHTDANSYLVSVRSKDGGKTWDKEPRLISAHPFGGSQDPCMVQLRDGTIVCASYAWAPLKPETFSKMKQPLARHGDFLFLGGYLVRSTDGGNAWEAPIIPPPCKGEQQHDLYGKPVPAYNRGAMCEGTDGKLYWVVASNDVEKGRRSATHLMVSADKGKTWEYSCVVARDEKAG